MKTKTPKQLSRWVDYILGRHPEQFGIVPDACGWIGVKLLLKVLNEEPGWRHVRLGHLTEALLTRPDAAFEMDGTRVRARIRENLPTPEPALALPRLLFTAVRQKAHPRVAEHGVRGSETAPVILCREESLAVRVGKRIERRPVILVVNTAQALALGAAFWTAGDGLFTAVDIPPGSFTGPPLPKAPQVPADRKPAPPKTPPTPGSYLVDPAAINAPAGGDGTADRDRKRRRRRQPPPWRR